MASIVEYGQVEKFQIRSIPTEWKKGYFFFSRFVWSFRCERGKWWQMMIFHLVTFILLMPIALVFDFITALVRFILKLLQLIFIKSIELFFEVLKMIIQALINVFGKVIVWTLVLSSIIVITIVLIYNWESLTSVINNLVANIF